jgi:hypothetical protein
MDSPRPLGRAFSTARAGAVDPRISTAMSDPPVHTQDSSGTFNEGMTDFAHAWELVADAVFAVAAARSHVFHHTGDED